MEWTFLINCQDEFVAGMITGILEEEGIAFQTRYQGSGDYMRILTGVGKNVDIFVPADKYQRAKEIIDALAEAEADPEQ